MSYNQFQYPAGLGGNLPSLYGFEQPRTDSYVGGTLSGLPMGFPGSVASTPQPSTGSLERGLTEDSEGSVMSQKRSAMEDPMSQEDELTRDWGNMMKLKTYIGKLHTQPFNSSTADQIFPAESQQSAYANLSLYLSKAHLLPHELQERKSTPFKNLSAVVDHLKDLLGYNWASSEVSRILSQGINDAVTAQMVQQSIWSNWETKSRSYVQPLHAADRPFTSPSSAEQSKQVTFYDPGWNSQNMTSPALAYAPFTQSQDSVVTYTGFRKTQPTFGTPSMLPPWAVGDASDLNFGPNMDHPHGTTSQSQTGTDFCHSRTYDYIPLGDHPDL